MPKTKNQLEKMPGYAKLIGTMQGERLHLEIAQRDPLRYYIIWEGHLWTGPIHRKFNGIKRLFTGAEPPEDMKAWTGTTANACKYAEIMAKKLSQRDKFLILQWIVDIYANTDFWNAAPYGQGENPRYTVFTPFKDKDGWEFAQEELQRVS